MNLVRRVAAAVLAISLVACVHTPPPAYQPAVGNTELLLQGRSGIRVGDFDAAAGVENEQLRARGASISGGKDGLYSNYLRDAVSTELETAGRLQPDSATTVEGTLLHNELNAGGVKTADAVVAARFRVKHGDETVYEQTLTAEHRWESSFMGPIAVPAALQNYVATVQKLLGQLFADPRFRDAAAGPADSSGK